MTHWKSKIAHIWRERHIVAESRLPFAMFAFGMLAYAAALAWHMLSNFDLVVLIGDANADDSFYYFQIAYNLSQGKFSTFDGGITQTNGYHPVWLMLITPFYWLFDKETALFAIKAFEIMLVAGGVALIAAAAYLARLAWPLLFAALPMLYRYPDQLLWGMEAAAAMFALALFILVVCLYMRDPQRWKWHLAAVAFALPWVRIEYIAISLAVTAALCVIEWSRQERRSLRPSELARIRHAYIPLIGAIAGILAYFAYNGLIFGGITPVSAATKLAWSQSKWAQEGGYSFIENLQHMIRLDAFDYELLISLEICAYLLLAWRLALRSNERRDWLLVAFLVGAFGLAAGHIAKFAQSVLIVHPYYANELWYFVPAYLMTALIIPLRLYLAILLIRRFLAPRRRIAASALSMAVVAVGAAILLGSAGFTEPFRWVGNKSATTQLDWDIVSYMGVQVMNRALPEGSVIGSRDSGVIGYFSRFPVVNMDGMVNSYEHLRARPIQQTEGDNFYRRYGITHFANNQWPDRIPNNVMFEGPPYDTPYGEYQFRLWTYDPDPGEQAETDYSQQIWDSLQPRFDYLADGVGVILAGRTVQAFAKDCAPDEPLAWTWLDQKHERTLIEPSLYQSRANMCVALRLLPHSDARPTQAKITPLKAYFANLIASSEPIIHADFDVYINGGSLIYAKSQCDEADIEPLFFANIFPDDDDDLPIRLRQRGYETINFRFDNYGATAADGNCWAAVSLPDYPVAEIHAGQYAELADGYTHIWEATYTVGEDTRRAAAPAEFDKLTDSEPIIRSSFDVYLIDGSLMYTKPHCSQEDIEPRFFANILPANANDLPHDDKQRGYQVIDFSFDDYGATAADGNCRIEISLPIYPIAGIQTGQYAEPENGYIQIWTGNYGESAAPIDATPDATPDFEKLAGREPVIRSDFHVYLIDGSLIYTKSQCDQADMEARIFADIFPANSSDLPDDAKQRGYQVIDFKFGDYGIIARDGRCWAEIALPDHPIIEIHTAQYVEMEDGYANIWEGSVYPLAMGIKPDLGKLAAHAPIIRADFDVYAIDGNLIYAKSQCNDEDVAGRFSMTIHPVDVNDMPALYWLRGYYTKAFKFKRYGAITTDGICWAKVNLPDFPIAEIRTGQYAPVEGGGSYLWDGVHIPGVASYTVGGDADFEALTDRQPIIRSDFNVYLIDHRLIYANQHCNDANIDATFSLNIIPIDANDLPAHLIQRGYATVAFKIDDSDITPDGKCWVEADLPDFPIAEIRTGQYAPTEGGGNYLWDGVHTPGAISYTVGDDADFGLLTGLDPIIRSDFNVYLIDRRIIYANEQCANANLDATFSLSITPVDANDLPAHLAENDKVAIDFKFEDDDITADGKCWAEANLPDYPLSEIYTAQYVATEDGYHYTWESVNIPGAASYTVGGDADFEALTGIDPIIRSDFDVYLIDRRLIYANQQCSEANLFLRIIPVDANDLPAHIVQRGYVTLAFNVGEDDITADGKCWAEANLPDFPIADIRTGQYVTLEDGYHYPWKGAYIPGVASYTAADDDDFQALTDREPIIRSDFDVYLIDRRLIYANEECANANLDATFSLNIFPVDANDLPAHLIRHGHATVYFEINDSDITADGRCGAAVKLPDFPIAEILTGQYESVEHNYRYLWEGAYFPGVVSYTLGGASDFEMLTDREPIIRSDFDVYLIDRRLIYANQQCSEANIFIRIIPVDVNDLPTHLIRQSHATIDFTIYDGYITADGKCWVEAYLPNYPIAEISTGQFVVVEDIYDYPWRGNHRFDE